MAAHQHSSPDQEDRWQRWNPKASVIGSIAGVGSLLVAVVALFMSTGPATVTTEPTHSPPNAPGSPRNLVPSGSPCRDTAGHRTACTVAGARLLAQATPCDATAAMASLGIDAQLQLDVTARQEINGCVVQPGRIAAAADASVASLASWSNEKVALNWLVCGNVDRNQRLQEVACSTKHTLEMVGPWTIQETAEGDASHLCDTVARSYTAKTFDGANPPYRLVKLSQTVSGTPHYRCAVQQEPAVGTLWHKQAQD